MCAGLYGHLYYCSIFLSRVRTAQPSSDEAITNTFAFASTVLHLALGCAIGLFCCMYIFDA